MAKAPLILEFWDIELPDLTVLRLVSFADSDAGGSLPTEIPFDGNNYTATKLARGDVQEALESKTPTLDLTAEDPTGTILALLQTHSGIHGQPVTQRLIEYEDLATPAVAERFDWQVVSVSYAMQPLRVTVHLGFPDLSRLSSPRLRISRLSCLQPWSGRHNIGNRCRYPSDDFGNQTLQNFQYPTIPGTVQSFRFGWYGRSLSAADRCDLDAPRNLKFNLKSGGPFQWLNFVGNGPYIYKRIAENAAKTVDFHSFVGFLSPNFQSEFGGIILATDHVDMPESWVMFGLRRTPTTNEYLLRNTVAKISDVPDLTVTATSPFHSFFRLERVGSTINAYTKQQFGDPWTLRHTVTNAEFDPLPAAVGGFMRAGMSVSSDAVQGSVPTWRVGGGVSDDPVGLRVEVGGFDDCELTIDDCIERENTHQIALFDRIPDQGRKPL